LLKLFNFLRMLAKLEARWGVKSVCIRYCLGWVLRNWQLRRGSPKILARHNTGAAFRFSRLALSEQMLAQAIAASNEAEPDLVLLTGDYVNRRSSTDSPTGTTAKHLQSRAGIYAVLGKPWYLVTWFKTEITTASNSIGILTFFNEIALSTGTTALPVGLADYWSRSST